MGKCDGYSVMRKSRPLLVEFVNTVSRFRVYITVVPRRGVARLGLAENA